MSKSTKNSIIKSAIIIAAIVVLSKGLGFIRDAIIAAFFGASYQTDAFFFASSMPGIPAISITLSTVFLPLYVKKRTNFGKEAGDGFASKVLTVGIIIAIAISAIAIIFSPIIVSLLAPGFDAMTRNLAIKYTRVITSTLFLVMTHYMLLAILNANKQFGVPQLSGALLNLFYIAAVTLGAKSLGINSLVVGALLGAVGQVAYLGLVSRKVFRYRPVFTFDEDVLAVFKLALPVLLGNAVIQIHEIVDQLIGSTLPSGTISVLTYGLTLSNLVKTIIINALSSVYYPYISEAVAKDNDQLLNNLINKTFIGLTLTLLPITAITIVTSREIISIVYERGSFSPENASLTSGVLMCYALGFAFSGIRELSSKTLYAVNRMSIVTMNGAIAVLINVILSYTLSKIMGVSGIALATSAAEIVTACLLMNSVRQRFRGVHYRKLFREMIKCALALLPLLIVAVAIKYALVETHPLFRFTAITIVGGGVYFLVLNLFKCEEATYLTRNVLRKFNWR